MSKVFLTYTYRIYPNREQRALIDLTFSMCRYMFNTLLEKKIKIHQDFVSYVEYCLKSEKNPEEKIFFKEHKLPSLPTIKSIDRRYQKVDSTALANEEKNVMNAFKKFYDGKCNFPRFKNRKDKNTYISNNVNHNIRLEDNFIKLPKIGLVKIVLHRNLPEGAIIKKAIVKEDKCGKYYIGIVIVIEQKDSKIASNEIVGLDFKVGDVFVTSNGEIPCYTMPYRNALVMLKKCEKELGRKIKFSKGYWKGIRKIRKLHHEIVFKRKDFLHKIALRICKIYTYICIENLSLQEIASKLKNGINTYDTSYCRFVQMLRYKVNGKVIMIDKWYPSSKTCSNCGYRKKKLKLSSRVYRCQLCGLQIDRDINAAINIRKEGEKILLLQNLKKIDNTY